MLNILKCWKPDIKSKIALVVFNFASFYCESKFGIFLDVLKKYNKYFKNCRKSVSGWK